MYGHTPTRSIFQTSRCRRWIFYRELPCRCCSSNATCYVDACGNTITPVVSTPSPTACEGPMVYTFTYTDCAGNIKCVDIHLHHRYTRLHVAGDESSTVNCPADAVAPTPPAMMDACGNTITPVVSTPSPRLAKDPWSTPSPIRIAQVIQMCGHTPTPSTFQTSRCQAMKPLL